MCFYEEGFGLLGIKVGMRQFFNSVHLKKPDVLQFVDFQSASLNGKRSMYLTTDHSGLNKFHGLDDENFQLLLPEIQRMADAAQTTTEGRFKCMPSPSPSHFFAFSVKLISLQLLPWSPVSTHFT